MYKRQRVGLLPLGEAVGAALAEKGSLPLLLAIAFILGLTVTVAEPNTRVLSHYVEIASGGRIDATTLITAVALGVAIFVAPVSYTHLDVYKRQSPYRLLGGIFIKTSE